MKIKFTTEALKALPSAKIGIILATKIQNRIDDRTIPILLNAEEVKIRGIESTRHRRDGKELTEDTDLYLYKQFELILSGKDIQRFNPLRDLCSLTGLRFNQPVFAISLEHGDPDITFEIAESKSPSSENSQRHISELICKNNDREIFNFIDGTPSDFAKVIPQTETALIFLIASADNTADEIQNSRQEIAGSIAKLLSGHCQTFEISPTQLEVELELQ